MNQAQVHIPKDEESELPIPMVWRSTFKAIVDAFIESDYQLRALHLEGVDILSELVAAQVRDYIYDYGETLVALPDETWGSSVCIWERGYWSVVVDLWTKEEGRSDLVLDARVFENGEGFKYEVGMVYVP